MSILAFQTPEPYDTALTTELDSLSATDGTNTAAGTAINNSSLLYPLADVSIVLGSINPTYTGARIDVHLLPRLEDGTNYAAIGPGTIMFTRPVATGSGIKYLFFAGMPLVPGYFKLAVTTHVQVALAASGNAIKIRRYGLTNI